VFVWQVGVNCSSVNQMKWNVYELNATDATRKFQMRKYNRLTILWNGSKQQQA